MRVPSEAEMLALWEGGLVRHPIDRMQAIGPIRKIEQVHGGQSTHDSPHTGGSWKLGSCGSLTS